jgi:hypothetical protein
MITEEGALVTTQEGRQGAVGGVDTGGASNTAVLSNAESCSSMYHCLIKKCGNCLVMHVHVYC